MGETGENVAERWSVSREDQDAFALRSQQRWAEAAEAGRFDDELVPVGDVARDEHPRPDTTLEKLGCAQARLPRGRHGHRRQLERASTTAPRRSSSPRRRRRASSSVEPLGTFVASAAPVSIRG